MTFLITPNDPQFAPVGEPAKPPRFQRGDYEFETRREYKKAVVRTGVTSAVNRAMQVRTLLASLAQ